MHFKLFYCSQLIFSRVAHLSLTKSSPTQVCSNGSRVYVHDSIWDAFVARLVALTAGMKVGDPMSEDTTVGATIHAEHSNMVLGYIERAKQQVACYAICAMLPVLRFLQ